VSGPAPGILRQIPADMEGGQSQACFENVKDVARAAGLTMNTWSSACISDGPAADEGL